MCDWLQQWSRMQLSQLPRKKQRYECIQDTVNIRQDEHSHDEADTGPSHDEHKLIGNVHLGLSKEADTFPFDQSQSQDEKLDNNRSKVVFSEPLALNEFRRFKRRVLKTPQVAGGKVIGHLYSAASDPPDS